MTMNISFRVFFISLCKSISVLCIFVLSYALANLDTMIRTDNFASMFAIF